MAKKRRSSRKLSQSKRARAIRETKRVMRARKSANKRYPKIKAYNALVRDFIEKEKQLGSKQSKKALRSSDKLKKIVKDLKSTDPFTKLSALKKTTRRDNVPDSIPVGETPSAFTQVAA